MKFALAAGNTPRLVVLDEVSSTNDYLAKLATDEELPEFTVVATTTQSAGRGRLGRTWQAPPGTSLAASVLLHPQKTSLQGDLYGWLPLIAGLAMSRAVSDLLGDREVSIKWPNDVLVESRKISGLLCELLPNGSVVVGSGVNLTIPADALPVPTATSLTLMGAVGAAEELADRVLANYLHELAALWKHLTEGDGVESLQDIREQVSASCSTLGKPVRLSLPDGTEDFGMAIDLDTAGRIRVKRNSDGSVQTVAAGDVTHLRYE